MLKATAGEVACRLRRPGYSFRDLTIRAFRANGYETELDKMKKGQFVAVAYFYGWCNEEQTINEWGLADIQKMIDNQFWQGRKLIKNKGGQTGFVAIPWKELEEDDYVLARRGL